MRVTKYLEETTRNSEKRFDSVGSTRKEVQTKTASNNPSSSRLSYSIQSVLTLFTFIREIFSSTMSDSDSSDYVVEDYVIPDAVRNTYNNEDLLSDSGGGSDSDDSGKGGESEIEDSPIKNQQCKLKNGTENLKSATGSAELNGTGSISRPDEDPEDDSGPEPPRANSRYILYVTNLSGETTKSMLEDFFGDAGSIRAIRIPKVRLGCYAFVEMKDFDGFKVKIAQHCKPNLITVLHF